MIKVCSSCTWFSEWSKLINSIYVFWVAQLAHVNLCQLQMLVLALYTQYPCPCKLLATLINPCQVLSTIGNPSRPFLFLVNICKFLLTPVNFCQHLSTLVNYCQLLNVKSYHLHSRLHPRQPGRDKFQKIFIFKSHILSNISWYLQSAVFSLSTYSFRSSLWFAPAGNTPSWPPSLLGRVSNSKKRFIGENVLRLSKVICKKYVWINNKELIKIKCLWF